MPAHAKRVFEGDIFDVYQWDQIQFDGTTKVFEKLKRDDTIAVVASLPDRRIIVETDEQPGRGPIRTFPAGRMDKPGEGPLEAAKRELLEETGYESDEWSLWKAFQPVTKLDWAVYVFVARNCRKTSEPSLDAGEKVEVDFLTLDEVIALAKDPDFVSEDSKADLIEAKYNPDARALLEKAFFG